MKNDEPSAETTETVKHRRPTMTPERWAKANDFEPWMLEAVGPVARTAIMPGIHAEARIADLDRRLFNAQLLIRDLTDEIEGLRPATVRLLRVCDQLNALKESAAVARGQLETKGPVTE